MKNISLISLLILTLTNLFSNAKVAIAQSSKYAIADPTELNINITVPVQSVTKTSVEGKIITVPVETEAKPEFSGYLGLDKNTPLISPKSTDLVVLATEIKIITASEELQQIVGKNLITKLGEGTSQQQLDRDVETLLNTGLFSDVKVITNANNQGIKITYKAQPIEIRRIEVTGNKVLSQTMIDDLFKSQIGAKISPELLNKSVEELQKWYVM
ncbi:MAG TPA: POTRA domain-containing protein, partial [Allocoleopsis sp.]